MKIAIIHDWLVTYAGAERVLEQMLLCYPQADLFSIVDFLPPKERDFLGGRRVTTSFLQNFPGAKKHYRAYLPLMPLAVEQLDLSGYDLVISSSHAVAKGVLVGPDQLHVCMCYSPIRYAWDLQHQYLRESGLVRGIKAWVVRWLLHKVRMWDVRTAHGVDKFVAISHFIARRIEKAYRRDSVVIYPSVNVDAFELCEVKSDFYLVASRMVPYKKMPMIVEAFNRMPEQQLVVIGDGPDLEKCKAMAGPNVKVLGYQQFEVMKAYLERAKAFVFAAEEDFGIAPLEAQACGTPVIAYGKGGALETIRGIDHAQPTGVFFYEQTAAALMDAVQEFEKKRHLVVAHDCRNNAQRFTSEIFRKNFRGMVDAEYQRFQQHKGLGT